MLRILMNVLYVINENLCMKLGDQTKKKNYGKIIEISASLTFLTLPMEER
jgi:hypothetical protein